LSGSSNTTTNTFGQRDENLEQSPTLLLAKLPTSVGKKAGERAACVKREWRDVVGTAKALGMYTTTVLSVAAGEGGVGDNGDHSHMAVS